jgi:G3E family GTPase
VVSLSNGCICCSLEGDLLRVLAGLLRRDPRPEFIVIETSGAADPADIVRNLMDPVILREAPLETVLCVVDASAPAGSLQDPLLRSQVRAADIVALSKGDLAQSSEPVRDAVKALRPGAVVVDTLHGAVPPDLLFAPDLDRVPIVREVGRRRPAAERFETLSWVSDRPVSLPAFQAAIGRLAPRLARAKGMFEVAGQPGRTVVFQFAGGRATLSSGGVLSPGMPRVRVVFVTETGMLAADELEAVMDRCVG